MKNSFYRVITLSNMVLLVNEPICFHNGLDVYYRKVNWSKLCEIHRIFIDPPLKHKISIYPLSLNKHFHRRHITHYRSQTSWVVKMFYVDPPLILTWYSPPVMNIKYLSNRILYCKYFVLCCWDAFTKVHLMVCLALILIVFYCIAHF